MWPVEKFYDGLNDLAAEEVRFAQIFRERGRDECYIIQGRKVQRFFFALGPEGSFSNEKSFMILFTGLLKVFESSDQGWEQWKEGALQRWGSDGRLCTLLESEERESTNSGVI